MVNNTFLPSSIDTVSEQCPCMGLLSTNVSQLLRVKMLTFAVCYFLTVLVSIISPLLSLLSALQRQTQHMQRMLIKRRH